MYCRTENAAENEILDSNLKILFGHFWTFLDKNLDIFNKIAQPKMSKWVILKFNKFTLQNCREYKNIKIIKNHSFFTQPKMSKWVKIQTFSNT